jgi:long-chain fatty acid transport protein
MTLPRSCVLVVANVLWLATPNAATGQVSLQVPLQFDFLNPGARSLAMGGAFAGLADDATAAFTNPAGLTMLGKPEVSAEGRYRQISIPFLQRGRLTGQLTNRLDDVIPGPVYAQATANITSPSFLSFVYPRRRWTVAAYRHELVRLRDDFQARGVFQDIIALDSVFPVRHLPLDATRSIDLVDYGFSSAYRLTDSLAVGAGISVYHLALDADFIRFSTLDRPDVFGAPDYSSELFRVTHDADGFDVAATAGFQWTPHRKVRIGGVYRDGPDFDVRLEETVSNVRRDGRFRVPDVWSAGVMIRPLQWFTLAFDYTFLQYSRLEDDYIKLQTAVRPEHFAIENGREFHAGVEYVFASINKLPAVRFGAWYDPDHSVRYEPTAANDPMDIQFGAMLPGGKDRVHYTAGAGLSLTQTFEINFAGDFTSERQTVSTSIVYRF